MEVMLLLLAVLFLSCFRSRDSSLEGTGSQGEKAEVDRFCLLSLNLKNEVRTGE